MSESRRILDGATDLGSVMLAPVHCKPDTPIREVLETMHRRHIGSTVVVDQNGAPIGILTLRDVLDRVVLKSGALDQSISSVMSKSLETLPPHATVHDAVVVMLARGIRHIPVVDKGCLVGIISEKDLFALQPSSVRHLAAEIRAADDMERLIALSADVRAHAQELLYQGTAPEALTEVIASLNDVLVQRVLDLEFSRFDARGVSFCWLALGSEGRREQTFFTDQDNGIIFDGSAAPDEARALLLPRAANVNDALARCGFPLCKGGVMAGNPTWCLSLAEWRQRFAEWIDSGDPHALLHSAIFFDFRAVHGERELSNALREDLHSRVARSPRFLHQMAANALKNRPPLGIMGEFRTSGSQAERGTIELKMGGAMPFVDAARIYSLAGASAHTNTCDRLREFARRAQVPALEAQAWIDGFLFVQVLRLRHQRVQLAAGEPLSNRVAPSALNDLERRVLKEALRQAKRLQARLALDYQL
jgi:CBS domain-containing protein